MTVCMCLSSFVSRRNSVQLVILIYVYARLLRDVKLCMYMKVCVCVDDKMQTILFFLSLFSTYPCLFSFV